jgi:hypothetical protein
MPALYGSELLNEVLGLHQYYPAILVELEEFVSDDTALDKIGQFIAT